MAMMRYGRTNKMTSPPDKVVKNKDGTTTTTSGKTSVTMSDWIKPEKTPAPKGYISEDDYNAIEAKRKEVITRNEAKYKPYYDAVDAYKKEQEDYKNSMDIYNRQLEIYKKGPSSQNVDPNGVPLQGGKNVKGQNVNFVASNSYSAEQSNKQLNDLIKSKKVVDIYDKSINPTSRKIFLDQVGAGGGLKAASDIYGTTSGKTYVDKDEINKIKSNIDVWGEDFNAVEFHEASRKGQLDKYIKSKGYDNRSFIPKVGFYQPYQVPQEPTKPTSQMPVKPVIEEEKVPEKPKEKIWLNKMPTRKVVSVSMKPNLKYSKDVKVGDEGEWQPPVASRLNVEVDKSREGGQGGKWGLSKKIVGSSGDKKFRPSLGISISGGRNKREEKMAKAFYSPTSDWGHGGYYSSMEGTEGNVNKAIRSDVKDIRAERKEWKKQTSSKGSDRRPALQGFREDIKTGRLSARYAKRGDLSSAGNETWSEGKNSRLKTWTADIDKKGNEGAMSGYVKSAEQDIQRASDLRQAEITNRSNAIIAGEKKNYTAQENYIKSAEDNATNRNSTQARMSKYWGWNKFGK